MSLCRYNTSKPCEKHGTSSRTCIDCILGEIRTEIEFEIDHRTNMLCAEDVLAIIDKYRKGGTHE